jgi:hypothetical protein
MRINKHLAAIELVERAWWPDGPRCPRCPDSRRFSRAGGRQSLRWQRCLSCYTCTSVTAGSFLRRTRAPIASVLFVFACLERDPDLPLRSLGKKLSLAYPTLLSLRRLWKANRATPQGVALRRELSRLRVPVEKPAPKLLQPSHPLHGLL